MAEYTLDFKIFPVKIAEVAAEMEKRGLLEEGAITLPRDLYALLGVPYLGPRHTNEKRRFERIKSIYAERRKKLQRHILDRMGKSWQWSGGDKGYVVLSPADIVNWEYNRIRRSIPGQTSKATVNVSTLIPRMNRPQKQEADKFMKQLEEIESMLAKKA